ncbi:hypothetical protein QQP08_008223 [Theobroma cacao]|nr:hypothetical protein QQP08_008223 [Theobroma cacao]
MWRGMFTHLSSENLYELDLSRISSRFSVANFCRSKRSKIQRGAAVCPLCKKVMRLMDSNLGKQNDATATDREYEEKAESMADIQYSQRNKGSGRRSGEKEGSLRPKLFTGGGSREHSRFGMCTRLDWVIRRGNKVLLAWNGSLLMLGHLLGLL